ncbi:mitochondrial ornithine carrier protein AmcA/Ort1 [Zopfochytrium polystomum]|nr:mitochondrial ornithine carrier protein AmcA/Ort1 [Zopfochytrium polystomum]
MSLPQPSSASASGSTTLPSSVAPAAAAAAAVSVSASAAAAAAASADIKIKKASGLADLVCGSVAGVSGKLVEYPFDTIKVRLQTQPLIASASSGPIFSGPLDCFVRSLRSEGFFGLYRGLSAPLVGSMIENSGLFLAYNQVQTLVRALSSPERISYEPQSQSGVVASAQQAPLTIPQLALCGVLSGAIVSLILTPVELIKCKLQVQGLARIDPAPPPGAAAQRPQQQYRGAWHIISHTVRTHGLAGFYRGHLGTLLREAGGGGAWFGVYELVCKHFVDRLNASRVAKAGAPATSATVVPDARLNRHQPAPRVATKEDLPIWQLMAAGALAGMAFNFSLYPADVIKSRMQTADVDVVAGPSSSSSPSAAAASGGRKGFVQVGRELYAAQGIRGLYRGCGITVARSAPTSAVIFATYETLSRHITF